MDNAEFEQVKTRHGAEIEREGEMELESMAYVAADPTQPGAAWAACSAQARFAKENAKDIASWLKKGAVVMLVTNEVARDMMLKWVRPSDAQRCLKFKQPNPPATPPVQAG